MQENTMPRLLLVEDDTVSRAFLHEALASLPATVDIAENIVTAASMASAHAHSLWLVDANLPDGNGIECLRALRRFQANTPALAITAEAHRDGFDALCQAGFLEVLQKPISVAMLQSGVRRVLGQIAPAVCNGIDAKQPAWDEHQALVAVGGNREILGVLRKLFIAELPAQRDRILAACARHDASVVSAELHKLKASCGFVGALRLMETVQRLSDSPLDASRAEAFGHAANDTLAAQS